MKGSETFKPMFIHDDFLLSNDISKDLYHRFAKNEPIFDYHCHLPPDQIASNHQFETLYDIWLAGDHYKWRAMRSDGVPEKFCTGDAEPKEKFLAWARTVPQTLRNPLYHWTHMELKMFFGITELLNEETAERIWDQANEQLASPEFSTQGLIRRSRVAALCTTDDPTDALEHHQEYARQQPIPMRLYPTFRPDKALTVDQPDVFNPWTDRLAEVSGMEIHGLSDFINALERRHGFFHSLGGRLSDHGLTHCYADPCTEKEAETIFAKARRGEPVETGEADRFRAYLMVLFGYFDAAKGWTKQLHLGAMRNNSSRIFEALGPDVGMDSIGDYSQGQALSRYLDLLDRTGQLPKTILYNLNPSDNYLFATMIGNFQDGSVAGKMQFGSGWWFLDQKEAMEWQMNALSNLGLLSRFVGMLTDSRSFLSYSRHDYFRRILCELLGRDVATGILPDERELLGNMVRDICFRNAKNYFGMQVGDA